MTAPDSASLADLSCSSSPSALVAIVHHDAAVARGLQAAITSMPPGDESLSVRCVETRGPGRLDPEVFAEAAVFVVTHDLPGARGPVLLERLRARGFDGPVVVVVTPGDLALAADLLEAGATDAVVAAPGDLRPVGFAVRRAMRSARMRSEKVRLEEELAGSLVSLELKNVELGRMIGRLERTVRTDDLTGLSNRRWLDASLAGAWAEAGRHDLPLGFVMIDLDGFKSLNDRDGHHAGDEVLRLVGRVLDANCRTVDVVARYGGDEFCLLLPHTKVDEAIAVARRVVAAFREAVDVRMPTAGVTLSIGVAHRDRSKPESGAALMRHADEAMYASKERAGDAIMVRLPDGRCVPAGLVELDARR